LLKTATRETIEGETVRKTYKDSNIA